MNGVLNSLYLNRVMLIDLLSIVTVLLSLITLSHTYHLCVVPWNESAKTGYQFEGEACIKFQIPQICEAWE